MDRLTFFGGDNILYIISQGDSTVDILQWRDQLF